MIVGDGSFNYSFQALWIAKEYNTNLKVVSINNFGYKVLVKEFDTEWLHSITQPHKLSEANDVENKECDYMGDSEPIKDCLEWLFDGRGIKVLEIKVQRE